MVTSETVPFGPMVCAWENAMFYMEDNTKQPRVSDRLHAAVQGADEVGFWCSWKRSGSVIMIGGSGTDCSGAAHGIGTTVAKLASFKIKEDNRRESDFCSNAWDSITKSYSLNWWIR